MKKFILTFYLPDNVSKETVIWTIQDAVRKAKENSNGRLDEFWKALLDAQIEIDEEGTSPFLEVQ